MERDRVCRHIGQRLRQRRWMLDMTLQDVALRVGVKYQQIQKYETGENRISADTLWFLAEALGVPIMWFFDGLDVDESDPQSMTDRGGIELLAAYNDAPSDRRVWLVGLARDLRHS